MKNGPDRSAAPRRAERRGGRSTRLVVAAVAAACAVVAVALAAGARQESPLAPTTTGNSEPGTGSPAVLESIRTGQGVRGAEILRPAGGDDLPGVVFLHGWGLVDRSDYRPWIRHLARSGNQVIVPRYQRDERSDPGRSLGDAIAGIRAAFRAAPGATRRLVVAGHSAGGALAADYAASARARGLPRAVAIFSVYPGRLILGYPAGIPEVDPSRIPAGTRILAMAGARDTVVGQAPAQELIAEAGGVGTGWKRYVLVDTPSVADHYGPTRATRRARRVFWGRLDRLIAAARR